MRLAFLGYSQKYPSIGLLLQGKYTQLPLALKSFPPKADPPLAETSVFAPQHFIHAYPSIGLLLQGKYTQLPLALKSLTSVFGMGTGVTSSLKTLGNVYLKCAGQGMCSPVRLWRDRRNRCDLFAQDTEKFLRTHKKHHNQ